MEGLSDLSESVKVINSDNLCCNGMHLNVHSSLNFVGDASFLVCVCFVYYTNEKR